MTRSDRLRVERYGTKPAAADAVNFTSGSVLSADVASRMSRGFGHTFANVRVHDGADGDQVARSFNARALAVGTELYFRQGEFAPETATGSHVLAHELAHVIQQRPSQEGPWRGTESAAHGRERPNESDSAMGDAEIAVDLPSSDAESEAHAAADALMAGESAHVSSGTVSAGTVQRWPWDDEGSGGGGMLDSIASVVGGGGANGMNPWGGGGLRSSEEDPSAIPRQIFGRGQQIMSDVFPSPTKTEQQVGQVVGKVKRGAESVIDPMVDGATRATKWAGGMAEDAWGWGQGLGERASELWSGDTSATKRRDATELEY
ncbi:MAG: DUF4157 domain-containing protein [Gemmatimonadaceae bacterium]